MSTLVTTVGVAAALCTSLGFIPQVKKMWVRKSVGDVSEVTFYQMGAGVVLWIVYGAARRDPVIIWANAVTLATLVAGLVLFYRYREEGS
jgi:MtN3 and saliva related transmembrane protein